MIYIIETRPGGSIMLHRMGAKELRESKAKWEPEGYRFEHISGARAHRYVKQGGIHSTDLYIDFTGRIRNAGIGC